jgi:site-specific DNA recombinase
LPLPGTRLSRKTPGGLRDQSVYTKATKRSDGTQRGGIRFTKGPLAYLLKNRVYVGEIVHKEKHFPGDHEPIIDSALFDEVQEVIRINAQERRQDRINNGSLLTGRIFDDRGNRMTPTSANKSGARYRYYVSSVIFQARKDEAGSLSRVPAPEIEAQVLRALRQIPNGVEAEMADSETPPVSDNALVEHCLEKIVVRKGAIEFVLHGRDESRPEPIIVGWTPPSAARRREIVGPDGTQIDAARPIRSETRARLVEGIAKARLWLDELVSGKVRSTSEIAKREACSERSIRMTMGLAFLSPPIVKAAIDGSLPNGVGITQLNNAPINWNQYSA